MQFETEKLLVQSGPIFATMFVRIWRVPAPRATIFCVHGYEGNGADFSYLADSLMRQGYTVVCPDMIGRGQSTYFGDPSKYTLDIQLSCVGVLSRYAGDVN